MTTSLSPIDDENNQCLFIQIYKSFYSDMLQYARHQLKGQYRALAEDVVQEAFLSLLKNAHVLQQIEEENIKPFLLYIVKCRIADQIRTEQRKDQTVSTDQNHLFIQIPDHRPSIEETVEENALYEEVCNMIRQLKDKYRAVLEMKLFLQLKESEIAHILGITEKNVSVRAFRGRRQLQKMLEEKGVL